MLSSCHILGRPAASAHDRHMGWERARPLWVFSVHPCGYDRYLLAVLADILEETSDPSIWYISMNMATCYDNHLTHRTPPEAATADYHGSVLLPSSSSSPSDAKQAFQVTFLLPTYYSLLKQFSLCLDELNCSESMAKSTCVIQCRM
jgi:hypothetical protein